MKTPKDEPTAPIEASPLLANHLSLLQDELGRQMEAAVRSEAETRGISLNDYVFDTRAMAFALRREQTSPPRGKE